MMSTAQPVISTPRLTIVPFDCRHLTLQYVGWLNDPEVMRYSEQRHQSHTLESCEAYWRTFLATDNHFWAIMTNEGTPSHIGNMTAYVDRNNGVADLGLLIGERDRWGCGYGLEAWNGAIDYLFHVCQVRKVTAGTVSLNFGMLTIMERSGMILEGRRRRQHLICGHEVDVIYAGCFRKEWNRRPGSREER